MIGLAVMVMAAEPLAGQVRFTSIGLGQLTCREWLEAQAGADASRRHQMLQWVAGVVAGVSMARGRSAVPGVGVPVVEGIVTQRCVATPGESIGVTVAQIIDEADRAALDPLGIRK